MARAAGAAGTDIVMEQAARLASAASSAPSSASQEPSKAFWSTYGELVTLAPYTHEFEQASAYGLERTARASLGACDGRETRTPS